MILKIIQTDFLSKFYYDTYTYSYTHKNLWHNMNIEASSWVNHTKFLFKPQITYSLIDSKITFISA